MWVDAKGVCHTVALPDPTYLMSAAFLSSLDQLLATDRDGVADAIDNEESRFFQEWRSQGIDAQALFMEQGQYEGAAPPVALLAAPFETVAELLALIRAIDVRWRLDALSALEDYCA